MADRFAELLAKGKDGRITPDERQELARLLNAPVLDALNTPPATISSKHRMVESDVVARLNAINWFVHCGDPTEFDLTMEVERVNSWPDAINGCKAEAWENAMLEARNQLTLSLHKNHAEQYRDWNGITVAFKTAVVTPLAQKVWEPFRQSHKLDIAFIHCVQWNILAALMENAYIGCDHKSFFFLELLTIYEAGHFPCGWSGVWPQGKVIVF